MHSSLSWIGFLIASSGGFVLTFPLIKMQIENPSKNKRTYYSIVILGPAFIVFWLVILVYVLTGFIK